MSEITRICAHCGKSSPLDAQFCSHCGYDTQAGLPTPQGSQLPMTITKAALPVLAGVAGLIVRAGWKLLKDRLVQSITPAAQPSHPLARSAETSTSSVESLTSKPRQTTTPVVERRARRTIHIRSSWAVGDARGVWRQGSSEQTIEIEE